MENIKLDNLFKNYGGILKVYLLATLIVIGISLVSLIGIAILGMVSVALVVIGVIALIVGIFIYYYKVYMKLLEKFYFDEDETGELVKAGKMVKIYIVLIFILGIIMGIIIIGMAVTSPLQMLKSLTTIITIMTLIIGIITSLYMVYFVYQVKETKSLIITVGFFICVIIVTMLISLILNFSIIISLIANLFLVPLYLTVKFNFANNMRKVQS